MKKLTALLLFFLIPVLIFAQVKVGTNFKVTAALPIDNRTVFSTIEARNALLSSYRYDGLMVYVAADSSNYQLKGGIGNASWVKISTSTGSTIDTTQIAYKNKANTFVKPQTFDSAVYLKNITNGTATDAFITVYSDKLRKYVVDWNSFATTATVYWDQTALGNALYPKAPANKMLIDNTATGTMGTDSINVLIYGDFLKNTLRFNGSTTTKQNSSIGGNITVADTAKIGTVKLTKTPPALGSSATFLARGIGGTVSEVSTDSLVVTTDTTWKKDGAGIYNSNLGSVEIMHDLIVDSIPALSGTADTVLTISPGDGTLRKQKAKTTVSNWTIASSKIYPTVKYTIYSPISLNVAGMTIGTGAKDDSTSIAIGINALGGSNDLFNIGIGARAGYGLEGTSTYNTIIGSENINTGSLHVENSTIIGNNNLCISTGNVTGSILLGNSIDNDNLTSRLIIDSEYDKHSYGLIEGDFQNRTVQVDGTLTVNTLNDASTTPSTLLSDESGVLVRTPYPTLSDYWDRTNRILSPATPTDSVVIGNTSDGAYGPLTVWGDKTDYTTGQIQVMYEKQHNHFSTMGMGYNTTDNTGFLFAEGGYPFSSIKPIVINPTDSINGKVGIGLSNPTTLLDVNGKVTIRSIDTLVSSNPIYYLTDSAGVIMKSSYGIRDMSWVRSSGNLQPYYPTDVVKINNTLWSEGSYGYYPTGAMGAGTRMLWIPSKSAFRAGTTTSTEWDSTNIGLYSSAFGYGNKASGQYSTAWGNATTSSGIGSTSLGKSTVATGSYSLAGGEGTNANSYSTIALGRYNIGGGSAATWVGTDPLMEIGNGSSISAKRNTITLLKNGNLYLNDSVFLTKVYNGLTSDSILTKSPEGKIRKMPYPGAGYWTLSNNTLYPTNTNNVISNAGFYAVGGDGDVNTSGDIASVDRTALLNHLTGTDTLTTIQRAKANISGTGIPNRTDAEAMRAVYDGRQTLFSARDTIQKAFGKAYNVDELGNAVIGDVSELYNNTNYNSSYQLDVRGSARIKGGSSLFFGDATTANLYAPNSDSLKTDDNFIAGQRLKIVTVPRLSGDADSALVLGANNILSYKKLPVGSGGTGGIISLQSQTNSYQTISTVSDANVTLSEVSSGGNHQFTTGWNGVLPIARGGTNGSTKTTAFNNLSPTSQKGDLIYRDNASNNIRLAIGTNGTFLKAVSGLPTWSNITISSVVALQDTLNELQHEKDTATYDGTKYDIINYAEPKITAGATTKYWRGDKTWQTLNDNSTTNEGQLSVPSALGNVSYATIASNTPGSSYIRTLKGDGLKLYHNQIVGESTVTETLEYSVDTNRVMVFSDTIQGSGKIATKKNLIDYAEPKITAGTSAEYWAGDKTWKTFPTISGDSSLWSISGNNIYSKNTGNVGIGNATPTNKLDVTSSSSITLASENTSNGTAIKGTSSNGVGVQGTSATGYQFRFGNDKNTTYDSTMVMTSGGRIALGSLVPDSSLTINGSLHTIGNSYLEGKLKVGSTITLNTKEYTFPNSYGTNNQVLTTDGSGGLQWSTKEGTGGTSGITSINSQTGAAQTLLGSTNIAVTNPGEDQHQISITGVIPVANGGTGANTLTGVLYGNGTSAVTAVALGTQGKFFKAGASTPVWDTIANASDKSRGLLTSTDWSNFDSKEPGITTGSADYYWNGSKQWTAFNDNVANNEGFLSMTGDNNGATLSSNTPFSGKVVFSPSLGINMDYSSQTVGGVIESQITHSVDTTKVIMFTDTLSTYGLIATKFENLWSIINSGGLNKNAYYNQAGTVNIGTQTSSSSKLQVKGRIQTDSLYSLGNLYIPNVGHSVSYDSVYVMDKTSGRVKLAPKNTTGGTVTSITVTTPLQASPSTITTTGNISIKKANTSIDGYIDHTDWNTFNNKPNLGTTYSTAARGYHRHDTLYIAKTYDTQSSKIAPYLIGYDSLSTTRVKFPSLLATQATGFLKVSNKGLVSVDNTTYQPLLQGTAGYLPKFIGTSTMGNSVIYQNTGSNVGIGKTTYINEKLDITGHIALNPSSTSGKLYLNRSALVDATSYFLGFNSTTKATVLSMSSTDVNNKMQFGLSASSVFTPKWTMFQSGNISIGSITDPGYTFNVTGAANITSNLTLGSSTDGYRFPTTAGTALQALRVASSGEEGIQNLEWFTPYNDPLTTKGDLLYRTATATDNLAIGSSGQVLTVYNGLPTWRNASTGFTNPMTEVGDMMIQVASDGGGTEPTRLDLGANGTILMSNGTIPYWTTLPAGTSHDPITVHAEAGLFLDEGLQDLNQTTSTVSTPGYLSATNFRHFNNKARVTGTVNFLSKISSDTLLVNSSISDNGTKVSITEDVSISKCLEINNDPDSVSGTIITMGVANGSAANDITAYKFVYVVSSGSVITYDSTITKPVIGMSLDTKAGGASVTGRILLNGFAKCSSWNFQNIGDPVYLGANGEATQTPPTDTGEMVQIVGIATGQTYMIVNPQLVTVILK